MTRGFRFPRWMIVFMSLTLFGVLVAIAKARDVQVPYSTSSSLSILPALVTVLAFAITLAAAVCGVMFAMKRSGVHRLSNVHAPRRR